MQYQQQQFGRRLARTRAGMTLAEVVVAISISGLAVAGIVSGYVFATRSAEKSALSLAANARAMERLEATRGAKWDVSIWPAVDQLVLTNFPAQTVLLDLSGSGVGSTYGTNVIQISQISTNPPLRRVRVDCIWRFNATQLLTNTIETCRAPDS
jgi:prepilin-type N-terminal cleavage/methylation domain-containing protein